MEMLLTLSQASKAGGISVSTLRRWCTDGRVDALKDNDGNWKVKESSLHAIADAYRASEKSGRVVQGATAVHNAPVEGLLKDTLERIVEPLRKALERETARLEEAQSRIRELETKLEARDTRIAQLQEERVADAKQGASSASVLHKLLEKVNDLEEQAHKAPISRLSDTVGSLFSAKSRR